MNRVPSTITIKTHGVKPKKAINKNKHIHILRFRRALSHRRIYCGIPNVTAHIFGRNC